MKKSEKSRDDTYKITHISLDNCRRVDIKVRIRHRSLTILVVIKETKLESSLILKKILEINEKSIEIKW